MFGFGNSVVKEIKNHGINDPMNPSSSDLKVILNAYIQEKSINADVLNSYFNLIGIIFTQSEETLRLQITENSKLDKKVFKEFSRYFEQLSYDINNSKSFEEKQWYYKQYNDGLDRMSVEREKAHIRNRQTSMDALNRFVKTTLVVSAGGAFVASAGVATKKVLDSDGGKKFANEVGNKLVNFISSKNGKETISKGTEKVVNSKAGKKVIENVGKKVVDVVSNPGNVEKFGKLLSENAKVIGSILKNFK